MQRPACGLPRLHVRSYIARAMPQPSAAKQSFWTRRGKRAFDLLGALLLIVLLSPLVLLCAIVIKLTSRGPVFFIQTRSGRAGVEFRAIKFRTMRGGRKPDPKELVPLHHPEITPIGRLLRRTKLDELPQLFNVLSGEMSLVGPRPTLPDQVAAYNAFQWQRMLVRPGLTGLAQVNSSASSPWDERIKYDVYYVHHQSIGMDLRILLKTVRVMLLGEERFARPFDQSPYREQ
jgi:lipopolysaccharide/colanic/teichoic acid biosynthesis glycosyltransferase